MNVEEMNNVLKPFVKGKKRTFKVGGRAVIYQRVSSKEQEDGLVLKLN